MQNPGFVDSLVGAGQTTAESYRTCFEARYGRSSPADGSARPHIVLLAIVMVALSGLLLVGGLVAQTVNGFINPKPEQERAALTEWRPAPTTQDEIQIAALLDEWGGIVEAGDDQALAQWLSDHYGPTSARTDPSAFECPRWQKSWVFHGPPGLTSDQGGAGRIYMQPYLNGSKIASDGLYLRVQTDSRVFIDHGPSCGS